ncbi:pantoate--beta-alanine ligase [Pseudactinotalea sp. HY160]|uniref:pantoate--beta-alanine ligase n=1 Tax=Pseudactinotalea sp. HY160 TaxID=2654490 RepID=UPI00128D3BC7|nr:pantoate--beta-alanine ligase [Pseudactinotalea sp. HY160]
MSTDPPRTRPGRLGIGVVGAGRVGAVLANALRACGHGIVAVSGASPDTLDRIDALLPGVPVEPADVVVARSELVFLTVPDDDLAPLVRGLADLGRFHAGQLVVHCAGRYGTEVLAPALAAGAIPLAIHPAMTFTGTSVDLARLVGTPFAVSAPTPVLPIAQALVVELGGEPVVLDDDARVLYHAALSHGANHLVTLTGQAVRTLAAAGVADGGALLTPLMTAALDGALRGGDQALTGPVSRGDAGTVADHLDRLARLTGPEVADVLPSYTALARATTTRALATGRIDERRAAALLDVLTPPAGADGGHAAGPAAAPAPADTRVRGAMRVVHTIDDLRAALPEDGRRRAVVMTMGALHAGHLELVRRAGELADEVVVTIFVNPLQFGAGEDLETYPRTFDADLAALTGAGGVDLVFAPSVGEMYPGGEPRVRVSAGEAGRRWEGAARPGHFDGMLTVVHKLLSLTRADLALFGQKDAQQLALIRAMVADLDLDVEIVAVPIVREADGLARSSRNTHLSDEERRAALVLSRSVAAAVAAADAGAESEAVLAAAEQALAARSALVEPDYLALVDPDTMEPLPPGASSGHPAGLIIIAARVGGVRLIDNALIGRGEEPRQEQDLS